MSGVRALVVAVVVFGFGGAMGFQLGGARTARLPGSPRAPDSDDMRPADDAVARHAGATASTQDILASLHVLSAQVRDLQANVDTMKAQSDGEQEASRRPAPSPSPEHLEASFEVVDEMLERGVWTQQDFERLHDLAPALGPEGLDQVMERILTAANRGQVDLDPARGVFF